MPADGRVDDRRIAILAVQHNALRDDDVLSVHARLDIHDVARVSGSNGAADVAVGVG